MADTGKESGKFGQFLKRIGKGALLTLSGLIAPIGLKIKKNDKGKKRLAFDFNSWRLGVFLLTYYVLQPLSIFLFPTARTVVKDQGLDPDAVQQVTSIPLDKIHIVPDNFAGKAYFLFESPPISVLNFYTITNAVFNPNVRGFEVRNGPGFAARLISPDTKRIFLKSNESYINDNNAELKYIIESRSGGLYTYKPRSTGRDFAQLALLHEIRHTDPENGKLSPLYCEADADYHALTKLSEIRRDPDLAAKIVSDHQISGTNADHDDILYLHCKFNNLAIPSEREMRQANMDAKPAMDDYFSLRLSVIKGNTAAVDSLTRTFNDKASGLSPLAQLRLDLYKDAVDRHFVFNISDKTAGLTPKP